MASTSGLKRARVEERAALGVGRMKREFKFAGKTGKYEEFLSVLSEYKHKRLDIPGVVDRMQIILHGHPYIIRWFNRFLPNGYQARLGPPRW